MGVEYVDFILDERLFVLTEPVSSLNHTLGSVSRLEVLKKQVKYLLNWRGWGLHL